jgi:uncharacterized membrane protein YoaK (UPF0700 family)
MEDARPTPPEQRLRVAALLSAAGGFLDAFTWIGHGGVFANAQTGNVVLLGLFAAAGEWAEALRHVPPIVAFVAGVFVAHRLRLDTQWRDGRNAAMLSLVVEILFLAVVALLPSRFPDLPIVLGVAFVAALQSSSFARVEGQAYSSVMTTGNLRRGAEAVFAAVTPPRDPRAPDQARVFGSVIACFCVGAALGAFATTRLGNASVVIPIALLSFALFLCGTKPAGTGQNDDSRASNRDAEVATPKTGPAGPPEGPSDDRKTALILTKSLRFQSFS